MIGLLCTTDGIPIAHHVFAGNTNDASTLSEVLNGLAKRFAVGSICVVADRRTPLQTRALTAIGVDTRTWDKATITQP